MQALKITLPGKYWDTQIYSGNLFLFDRQGTIRTINWDSLVENWKLAAGLRLPMTCAFQRSDYLYGNGWDLVFSDSEFKGLLVKKFDRLSKVDLVVSSRKMDSLFYSNQDSPFPFPHTDCKIYGRKMYVASHEGLHYGSAGQRTKYSISSRSQKKWDAPIEAISLYGGAVAIAAGEEGLFETRIGETSWGYEDCLDGNQSEIRNVSKLKSDDCRWAYGSIFSSTYDSTGYLASFDVDYNTHARNRKFDRTVGASEIFGHEGCSWACQDKICQAGEDVIRINKYQPWLEKSEQLKSLPDVSVSKWAGEVISGDVAVFGVVVECENAIVVIPSDAEEPIVLPGEPVRWRIFPRSRHYENQLHVVYEDFMQIWSFNHDYFVNQKSKIMGIKNSLHKSPRSRMLFL